MLDLIIQFVSNGVMYPLIVPGIFGGGILILFSFFMPSFLAQYKIPALLGGIALVLFFTFQGGRYSESTRYEAQIAANALRIKELEILANTVTVQTIIKYVDRIKVVEKIKVEYVNVYVDTFVPQAVSDSYPNLPNGWVRIHDFAAEGGVPGAPRDTDAQPSEIGIAGAAKVITSNYMMCHATELQLEALQQWIRDQQKLLK